MSRAAAPDWARQRPGLKRRLRGLLEALEDDDRPRFQRRLDSLLRWRQRALVTGLSQLASELRCALREVALDSRLAEAAANEIPDACARLEAVLQLTEQAAHRTLDLGEQARERVLALEGLARAGEPQAAWAPVARHAAALRSDLSAMAEAQSYQDLSGQIINRVIQIVQRLEQALGELLKIAGLSADDVERRPTIAEDGLEGPVVAGVVRLDTATQDDADALLADLGM